jgi:hypothetical protein
MKILDVGITHSIHHEATARRRFELGQSVWAGRAPASATVRLGALLIKLELARAAFDSMAFGANHRAPAKVGGDDGVYQLGYSR